ncbi:protein of unknown function [Nitrospira defluvii]|jgi:hypothetical protein|uniref:Uncharacterized protein n=1 Tax=Nitrospira defluvii TaxID=330214 RepID=D8P8P3_9BACT|nr:protein of unknown function [Nitrospira defluvii]
MRLVPLRSVAYRAAVLSQCEREMQKVFERTAAGLLDIIGQDGVS